jgi:hypothetical protein
MLTLKHARFGALVFVAFLGGGTARAQTSPGQASDGADQLALSPLATVRAPAAQQREALKKSQTRIRQVEKRLAALPQDSDQVKQIAVGIRSLLDVAARFQARGDARLAHLNAELADGLVAHAERTRELLSQIQTSGVQP